MNWEMLNLNMTSHPNRKQKSPPKAGGLDNSIVHPVRIEAFRLKLQPPEKTIWVSLAD
jgi:hypothetical protein